MYQIDKLKQQILEQVAGAIDLKIDVEKLEITVPPDSTMGDLSVPCFYLSKVLKRAPNIIAEELQAKIHPAGAIKDIKSAGPYLNFFINPKVFGVDVLSEILKTKNNYGRQALNDQRVMIEYSQPNTHKEFHIGHSRNAILGCSLVNLFRFGGHKVIATNYIGDIGAHVAKCLWALKTFYADETPSDNKGKFLGQVYTEATRKVEENEELKKEVAQVLQQLEAGDKEWLALWKKTRQWSLDEFDKIYKLLGCEFDHIFYESEVEKSGKKIVQELLDKKVAIKSQGAVIIDLDQYNLKQFLLLKSDGSSLYSTKDIALAELKAKKFKIDKSLVVIDKRQDFYFQQLMQTLSVMGFKNEMATVLYEFVTLKDGAMSSRKGNVVLFEDFYNEVVARAKAETTDRHSDWPEKKINDTARKIALSAIKFNMLKTGNDNIIVFDIEEALSFDGFTGPYLQYTVSRINSILKKSKAKLSAVDQPDKLSGEIETELVLKLAEFPEAVRQSILMFQPSETAKYLFELAKIFAAYYQKVPILNSPPAIKRSRLALVEAVRQTLVNGLEILGIEPLDEM